MVARDIKAPVRTSQLLARMPAFSPVALRLMAIISSENVSFKEVSELIRLDPALTGEVLSLANSGLYGRRFPVRSVTHAMALVGIRKVGSIVITAALWKSLPRRGSPFVQAWWRHSVAAALVADHVSAGQGIDSAYTAGLLHSIGQLALFQYAPDQYVEDLKLCCSGGGDLLEQEHETYGTDHAALSSAILTQWGLAEDLREAVAQHHDSDPFAELFTLPAAVQTACMAAESAGFGSCGCHQRIATGDISDPVRKLIDSGYLLEVLPQELNAIECSLTP